MEASEPVCGCGGCRRVTEMASTGLRCPQSSSVEVPEAGARTEEAELARADQNTRTIVIPCNANINFVVSIFLSSQSLILLLTFPYLSLPFLTIPYLSLPFLTFHYLSLPFLSLPSLTFPYFFLPLHTFPHHFLHLCTDN